MWLIEVMLAVVLLAREGIAEEPAGGAVQDCICVPYYLCRDVELDGPRIIDIPHVNNCETYLEVCCKNPQLEPTSTKTPPPTFHNKTCGTRNLKGIGFGVTVDGNDAQYGEFPWMAAVLKLQKIQSLEGKGDSNRTINIYMCGGSLIHPSVVMTAAHCIAGTEGVSFIIRAGEWDTQTRNELYKHQDRDVKRIVVHEDYQGEKKFNDVALLFLSEPVLPAENIGFACLPAQGFTSDEGTHCVASGWGKDKEGKEGRYSVILKKVELPVVDNQQCEILLQNTSLGLNFTLHDSFICAGGEKGKGTCKGDEGSPLVCPLKNNESKYIQSGIVSWGIGCGEDKIPGVYANVANFRKWIDIKMSEAGYETSYYTY